MQMDARVDGDESLRSAVHFGYQLMCLLRVNRRTRRVPIASQKSIRPSASPSNLLSLHKGEFRPSEKKLRVFLIGKGIKRKPVVWQINSLSRVD